MTYLDLTMHPNPPAAERAQLWLLVGVATIMLFGALRFLWLGAWMVLPFMVLDVGLLWWALRSTTRAARTTETVRLDDAGLIVHRVTAAGIARTVQMEPAAARVVVEGRGSRDMRLWLAAREARVRLGEFLTAAEREAVCIELEAGLNRWRRARR